LAIFDDLGTILLMIPLKVMMVGFKWELLLVVGIMFALLAVGWRKLHSLRLPHTWQWTLLYGAGIAALCHLVHHVTHYYIDMEAIHIEVLLPSFIMGCLVDTPCAHAELEIQRQNSKEMLIRKASSNSIIDGASETKVEGPSAASTEAAPAASNIAHSSNSFEDKLVILDGDGGGETTMETAPTASNIAVDSSTEEMSKNGVCDDSMEDLSRVSTKDTDAASLAEPPLQQPAEQLGSTAVQSDPWKMVESGTAFEVGEEPTTPAPKAVTLTMCSVEVCDVPHMKCCPGANAPKAPSFMSPAKVEKLETSLGGQEHFAPQRGIPKM
jgi:hypothetical protein